MKPLRALLTAVLLFALPAVAAKPAGDPASKPAQSSAENSAEKTAQTPSANRPEVDVAFVLDTTGSMGGLLEGAKQKIWSIASNIARGKPTPILRVGVVAYRDKEDVYVAQRFDLTRDLDAVYAHLKTLDANGGGDIPEHVGRGLGEAVKNLSWSHNPNAMKMIFVVGDAPPQHYQDGWSAEEWAKRATTQGIVVNTIRCGGDGATAESFQTLAKLGHGSFASIESSGGVVTVTTPYDKELARINSAIASKTVFGGAAPARAEAEERARSVGTMDDKAAADRLSYAGSGVAGGLAKTFAPAAPKGTSDLTGTPAAAATMAPESLPAELRKLKPEARGAYLSKLADERSKLEKDATRIAAERDSWMATHVKAKKDSLDGEVMNQVKALGAKHGIAY